MKIIDALNTSIESAKAALFESLDIKAMDALSGAAINEASMAIAKLKAAHSMGYKWHKDIPEESDERMELESRAKKIYDEDAAKEKAEMETPK